MTVIFFGSFCPAVSFATNSLKLLNFAFIVSISSSPSRCCVYFTTFSKDMQRNRRTSEDIPLIKKRQNSAHSHSHTKYYSKDAYSGSPLFLTHFIKLLRSLRIYIYLICFPYLRNKHSDIFIITYFPICPIKIYLIYRTTCSHFINVILYLYTFCRHRLRAFCILSVSHKQPYQN